MWVFPEAYPLSIALPGQVHATYQTLAYRPAVAARHSEGGNFHIRLVRIV